MIPEIVLLRHLSLKMIYFSIALLKSLLVLDYASYVTGMVNIDQGAGALMALGSFALLILADTHP
ncbi:hypothetical protein OAN307_c28810 [Octadecabacter antarcticus 307]|uniref:Uncharacterized protein n=2 Tax=Octadecabacter TaxID=53945 RepID=M9R9J7_9RHOB|nr:hypothetical protein OAN307_c28810 [Octadecabacter antarcticus 307]